MNLQGEVICSTKVAHVTFSLTCLVPEGDDRPGVYHAYSAASDEAVYFLGGTSTYNDAVTLIGQEIAKLEEILERKRKGYPTAKQLYFLFCQRIPIPLDLTWGQASDLIEETLAQLEYEREAKRKNRFNGLEVGDAVALHYPVGGRVDKGTIRKLTQSGSKKYAYIALERGIDVRTSAFERIEKLEDIG